MPSRIGQTVEQSKSKSTQPSFARRWVTLYRSNRTKNWLGTWWFATTCISNLPLLANEFIYHQYCWNITFNFNILFKLSQYSDYHCILIVDKRACCRHLHCSRRRISPRTLEEAPPRWHWRLSYDLALLRALIPRCRPALAGSTRPSTIWPSCRLTAQPRRERTRRWPWSR